MVLVANWDQPCVSIEAGEVISAVQRSNEVAKVPDVARVWQDWDWALKGFMFVWSHGYTGIFLSFTLVCDILPFLPPLVSAELCT